MKKLFTLTRISLLIFAALTLFSAYTKGDNNPETIPVANIEILSGKGAERIYLVDTGDSATLQLTKEQNYTSALFQFGSVIGYDQSNNLTAIYNPTSNTALSTWNTEWTGDAVHSVENLKAGKGDPCRLVGYKASEVRAMLAANILPDNGQWRTPTNAENIAFPTENERTDWNTVGESNGHYFPTSTSTSNWLPASGYRYHRDGLLYTQGNSGLYWSTTTVGTVAYSLLFISGTVLPSGSASRGYGFAVRCIKN